MFKSIFKKKKERKNRKKLHVYVVCIVLVLTLVIGIYLIVRTKPNDNISVLGDSMSMFGNENPSFSVDFGKKEEPDKQWIRFEAKAKHSNPFEKNKSEFFAKVFDFVVPKDKYGIEMSLKGVTLADVEELNLEGNEEKVKSVRETLTINDVSTSSELIESGRVIGEVSEEPIAKKTVVNRDVAEGVDLEYQILKGFGLKEEIVIKNLEEYTKECGDDLKNCKLPLNEFIFELKLDEGVELKRGLYTLRGKSTEVYYFTDPKGNYVSHFLPNWAQDASGERTYDVELKIEEKKDGNYEAKVIVDINWLFSPQRAFPVRIDPSIVHDTQTEFDSGYFYDTESLAGPKVQIKETQSYPIDSNTVGYWKLDEASGSGAYLLDSSGNNFHGTPTGTTFTNGRINGSRTLNGTSEYITVTHNALLNPTAITIEAWIKPSVLQEGNFVNKGDNTGYRFRIEASGNFVFFDRGATNNLASKYYTKAGEWVYVVATGDSSGLKIYINGELDSSKSTAYGSPSTTANLILGCYSTGVEYFAGAIDEVRISNIARTPEEIQRNYLNSYGRYFGRYASGQVNLGGQNIIDSLSWSSYGNNTGDGETPFSTTGLLAQWNFNETSGTTAASGGSCGATCNGTLTGFASTTGQDVAIESGWTKNNRRWGAGSLMLDGTNDYMVLSNNSSLDFTTGDFSLEVWVNSSMAQSAIWPPLISKEGGSPRQGYNLFLFGSTSYAGPKFEFFSAGTQTAVASTKNIRDRKWHHIVAVKTSSTVSLYIDGQLDQFGSHSNTGSITQLSVPFKIGTLSAYAKTIIDEARVYSRALSSGEVLSNYQSGNIEFQYKTSSNGTTWSDWSGGTEHEIESFDNTSLYDKHTDGLVAYWGMDETSGSTVYDLANSNDGTAYSTSITDGKFGKARGFDGTSSYITASSVDDFTNTFTIEAWVNFAAVNRGAPGVADNAILGHGTISTNNGLHVGERSGKAYFGFFNNDLAGNTTLSINTWYHLVYIYDGTYKKIYVNGKLDSSATSVAYQSTLSNTEIGRYPWDTDGVMLGSIDEVRVYGKAIDEATILNHYLQGAPNIGKATVNKDTVVKAEDSILSRKISSGNAFVDATTVGYWKLDETGGSGAYIKDSSSNGNHGTPYGATYTKGHINGAYSFDGVDDYIEIPSNFGLGTANVTLSAWVNLDSTSESGAIIKVGADDLTTTGFGIGVGSTTFDDDGNNLILLFEGLRWINTTDLIGTGWHHVAMVLNSSGYPSAYIDGNLVYSDTTGTATAPSSNSTKIGGYVAVGPTNRYLDAIIDDVQISPIARTANEIAEIYRMGRDTYVNSVLDEGIDAKKMSSLPFWIASDTLGTNMDLIAGNSPFANYQSDQYTVGLWSMEEQYGSGAYIADSSGRNNNGTPTGTSLKGGMLGKGRSFDGSSYITLGNPSDLQMTGDQTIDMWVFPTSFSVRRNPYAKAYGGEGTITQETTGILSYYYGTAGANTTPYQDFGSVTALTLNNWHHIAVVRDLKNMKLYWYIDGVMTNQATASYSAAVAGSLTAYIGTGYTNPYAGVIDEFRMSNTARSWQEIKEVYEVGRRTHPITISFKADLQSSNLISSSSDTSFSIDETVYEASNYIVNLEVGEKIIVKQNYDGVEYIAQGTVATLDNDTGAVTVSSWDSGSTFPSSGFTVNATVFKWQKEIFDIRDIPSELRNNISLISLRLKNPVGANFWVDDIKTAKYLSEGSFGNEEEALLGFNDDVTNRDSILKMEGPRSLYLSSSEIYKGNSFTSVDISSYNKMPFWVASDELGRSSALLLGGTSDYSNYIPDTNTVGYWKLDEVSGTGAYINDYSSSNYDCTPTGTTHVEGKISGARYFDGLDDYMTSSGYNFTTENFTISMWIKPTNISNSPVLLSNGAYNVDGYYMHIDSGGSVLFYTNQSGANQITRSLPDFRVGSWQLLTVVRSGASVKIYRNGVDITSSAATHVNPTSTTRSLFIGSYNGEGYYYKGFMDEVIISNTARTAAEIYDSYNISGRGIQPEIKFKADLQSSNLISSASDTSFTISETAYGTESAIENLQTGDKIIVTESTYKAQGTVSSVNSSTGAVVVNSWSSDSTFPGGGFTVSASVFKWQKEYLNFYDLDDAYTSSVSSITALCSGVSSCWYDDIRAGEELAYLDAVKYFQYKTLFTKWDNSENLDLYITQAAFDYSQASPTMDQIMRHGKWFNESGKQPFWWAQ